MPKLLAFIVCEKVILEKEHETPTIVSVIQRIQFQTAPGSPMLPQDAMAPMSWQIFTIWLNEGEGVGKNLLQKFELVMPDNSPAPGGVKGTISFVEKSSFNFNVIKIMGFPVGHPNVKVRLWLESPTGEMLSPDHFYPIEVQNITASSASSESQTE